MEQRGDKENAMINLKRLLFSSRRSGYKRENHIKVNKRKTKQNKKGSVAHANDCTHAYHLFKSSRPSKAPGARNGC